MIKSYLINMQRSSDRLQAMSARFDALGLPFERIAAVDGATLTDEQIADFVRERPLEGSGDAFSTGPRKWTASNIGCFLSHQAAWRIATDSADAYTAIFEDDMHLSDTLPALLASTDWLPGGNSIVRLERPTTASSSMPRLPTSPGVNCARCAHRRINIAGRCARVR